jgi:hypothetical protein
MLPYAICSGFLSTSTWAEVLWSPWPASTGRFNRSCRGACQAVSMFHAALAPLGEWGEEHMERIEAIP